MRPIPTDSQISGHISLCILLRLLLLPFLLVVVVVCIVIHFSCIFYLLSIPLLHPVIRSPCGHSRHFTCYRLCLCLPYPFALISSAIDIRGFKTEKDFDVVCDRTESFVIAVKRQNKKREKKGEGSQHSGSVATGDYRQYNTSIFYSR